MSRYKYHYFYKITNVVNGYFYYGVHNTNNLDDGYMGSGTRIGFAIKEFGIENFSKEILKFFDSSEDAFRYESEFVTDEMICNENCYNQARGGKYSWSSLRGTIAAFDKNGNYVRVTKDDERWLSGELVGITKGKVAAIDSAGNSLMVDKNDSRLKDGTLKYWSSGMVCGKDKNGKIFYVAKDDPRWINGELTGINVGRKCSDETKRKISEKNKGNIHKTCYVCNENEVILIETVNKKEYLEKGYQPGRIYRPVKNARLKELYNERRWQDGERNSHYGKCWIYNDDLKMTKSISRDKLDIYISNGWCKGRKMSYGSGKNVDI